MANVPSYRKQVIGSLLAALILTVLVVAIVTARLGPDLDSDEPGERDRIAEEQREDEDSD